MHPRLLIVSLASPALFAAAIFWPAGTLDWLQGWLYFGLATTSWLTTFVYLQRVNPEVIEHRLQFKKGTKPWDKLWFVFFTPATWDSLAGACPPPCSWAHGGHCFQRCYPLQAL